MPGDHDDSDRPTIELARFIASWDQGVESTRYIPHWATNLAMELLDGGLAAHDARVRAEAAAQALRDAADQKDREAAEDEARYFASLTECRVCGLAYGERRQYPCLVLDAEHDYDREAISAAASDVQVEPTHEGDWLRARADTITQEDRP